MALTDLTRVSTSGIATGTTLDNAILRKDTSFKGNQVGVTSALFDSSERQLDFKDNVKLRFGDSGDLSIFHDGSNNNIKSTNGHINVFLPTGRAFSVGNSDFSENIFMATEGGACTLYHDSGQKLTTTSTGVTVTGALTTTDKIHCNSSNSGKYVRVYGSSGTGRWDIYGNGANLRFSDNDSAGSVVFDTAVTAASFSGNGASLTNVNATTLDSIDSGSFLRSDANDTMSGELTLTTSGTYPIDINGSSDAKIVLRGSNNPYIRFRESNTDKAYIQWNAGGYISLFNQEDSSGIIIRDAIGFTIDGSNYHAVWHAGNDGSGSGLDADTCDGQHLSTSHSPTFESVYANDWFRNNVSGEGLYNSANDAHFYSAGANYWHMNGDSGGITHGALILYDRHNSSQGHATGRKGYLYWDSAGFGLLHSGGGWAVKTTSSATTLYGTLTHNGNTIWHAGNDGSGSGLDADTLDGLNSSQFLRSDTAGTIAGNLVVGTGSASYITMVDNDHGSRQIHCNSDRIGFLNSSGAWSAYSIDDGSFTCENNLTVGNGLTASTITMGDSNEGSRAIHNNSNFIGFLKADGNWGSRCADDGSWQILGNTAWHAGNDGSGSGLDADTLDGVQASGFVRHNTNTGNLIQFGSGSNSGHTRTSYAYAIFQEGGTWSGTYPDLCINYHTGIKIGCGAASYGGLRFTPDYNDNTVLMGINDSITGGSGGSSNVYIRNKLLIGGQYDNNPYNSVSSTRLLFGGGNDQDNYHIGTNLENYGGNYTKLDLRWHTGIRMGAQAGYGGIRFFDSEDLGTVLFSIGKGDTNTRVESGAFYVNGGVMGLGTGVGGSGNPFKDKSIKFAIGDDDTGFAHHSDGIFGFYGNGQLRGGVTSDGLAVYGAEDNQAALTFEADEGDDNADKWQIVARTDGQLRFQGKHPGDWRNAGYFSYNSSLGHMVFRGPAGGLRYDDNINSPNWNNYSGDGQAHRSNGQAYHTADDHFRIRKNGSSENRRFDLRTNTGHGEAQNNWNSNQFDFAEMFEWSDGNPSGEDRIGHTVAVDGLTGKIKIAADGDTVIGVVSGTAAFVGNAGSMTWHGAYLRDEWGRFKLELVKDEDGNQLYGDPDNGNVQPKVNLMPNPDWDESIPYHRREDRKEWDAIGIIGQCYVRKTAVIPSSWIKLKEIDSTKDFYLIK